MIDTLAPRRNVCVPRHAVLQGALARLRDRGSSREAYRAALSQIARVLVLEAARHLPTRAVAVETPFETTVAEEPARPVTLVAILRSGLGMLPAALEVFPAAGVGHLGIRRDEETYRAVPYYEKLPPDVGEGTVLLLDPMLATGGTACHAIGTLRRHGCHDVRLVSVVAAPEGLDRVGGEHPTARIVVAAVDRCLDEHARIRPGIGDAGDRLFGTEG